MYGLQADHDEIRIKFTRCGKDVIPRCSHRALNIDRNSVLFDGPLHPYTKALFSAALPAHPSARRDEIVLTGEVPSPIDPPSGCRFHPRCPFAMPVCAETAPTYKQAVAGHWVACHLY